MCVLPNGILLSCAYDNQIIAWQYQTEKIITQIEKKEELRCMDFIETIEDDDEEDEDEEKNVSQRKLFVGTN